MTRYTVTARRSGDWWALEVPDLPGVFNQAKRLDTAETAAREAIAVMLDIEPEDVLVDVRPDLPDAAVRALAAAEEAKTQAAKAAEAANLAMLKAVVQLTEELSQRDAGRILGLSFQRVSQLLKESASREAAESLTEHRPARSRQPSPAPSSRKKAGPSAKEEDSSRLVATGSRSSNNRSAGTPKRSRRAA